ncbi:MAG: hypothetical protein CBD37_00030 [Cyanobacteria bacterium TMED177]|nr:MAG: hypothetical protein CBD37_00030 [Cyanobacteria bacterium TMED177]
MRDGLIALLSQTGQHHLRELLNRQHVLISWHLNRDLRGWISASCEQATAQLEQELKIEPGRGRQKLLHDQARGIAQLVKQRLIGFVLAQRPGALLEDPFTSATFGLPLDHICAEISADLLGQGHPSALPAQGPRAQVWT